MPNRPRYTPDMSWGEVFRAREEFYAGEGGRLLEELINNHYEATMPQAQTDFVGLEQLGEVGEEVGVARRVVSRAYSALLDRPKICLDPLDKANGPKRPIDLSAMGLVVCERVEVGFPDCPPEVMARAQMKPPKDRVVQVAGLVAITPHILEQDLDGFGAASYDALEAISIELAKLPEFQAEDQPAEAQ